MSKMANGAGPTILAQRHPSCGHPSDPARARDESGDVGAMPATRPQHGRCSRATASPWSAPTPARNGGIGRGRRRPHGRSRSKSQTPPSASCARRIPRPLAGKRVADHRRPHARSRSIPCATIANRSSGKQGLRHRRRSNRPPARGVTLVSGPVELDEPKGRHRDPCGIRA